MTNYGLNSALNTSLRGLSHPLTLASLAVLLLNDHWLKSAMPSLLTGKLSDFAGLFFFPFLLAALLGLVLDRWHVPARLVAAISFSLTLAWFTALKTLPAANLLTRRLAGVLIPGEVQIALDPGDLLALFSLVPAWLLWLSIERQPLPHAPRRLSYLILGTAALATIATSPGAPRYYDRFVLLDDGILLANGPMVSENLPENLDENTFAYSSDGEVWQSYTDISAEIWQAAQAAPVLPKQVCRPFDPQECYRITGQPQVERSTNGGQTWQVDWEFPEERLSYMSHKYLITPAVLNINPLDLAILELADGPRVVAAMGDQGALLRLPHGGWQQVPVLYAIPTDVKANNIMDALSALLIEEAVLGILVLLGMLIFSIVSWTVVLRAASDTSRRGWALRPLWLLAAGALLSAMANWITPSADAAFNVLAISLTGILTLAGLIWTWVRVGRLAAHPSAVLGLAAISFLGPLAAGFVAWIILVMWAFAVIPVYSTALVLAALSSLVIIALTMVVAVLLARWAIKK